MKVAIAISISAHQLREGNFLHICIGSGFHKVTHKVSYQNGDCRSLSETRKDITPVMLVVGDAAHSRVKDQKDEPSLVEMLK